MAQSIGTHQKTTQGGGRGLLMVWRRELPKKLGIIRYLPGQSRGVTLAIMVQMDKHPRRSPGIDQETIDQKTLCNYDRGDIESTRTQYCQLHPWMEEAPQRLPIPQPQCLCRGTPICSFQLPLPTPPSLDSLTKPDMRLQFPLTCLLTLIRWHI